jgi:hypothetical protein
MRAEPTPAVVVIGRHGQPVPTSMSSARYMPLLSRSIHSTRCWAGVPGTWWNGASRTVREGTAGNRSRRSWSRRLRNDPADVRPVQGCCLQPRVVLDVNVRIVDREIAHSSLPPGTRRIAAHQDRTDHACPETRATRTTDSGAPSCRCCRAPSGGAAPAVTCRPARSGPRRTTSSGTVSFCRTPVIDSTRSPSDSRCWMLTVETTSTPAASSSSTSCQRLVARARHVGVGELVDQGDSRGSTQHRVHVHLRECGVAVLQFLGRHMLHAVQHDLGTRAVVVFHEGDHAVGAALDAAVRFGQHRVRLADAGRRAQVDPELAASHGARHSSKR